MSLDASTFEALFPSRFITFTFPNPTASPHYLHTALLRVAVLDSPIQPTTGSPRVAAMIVPFNRETDWIFSTEHGHLQLLLNSPEFSRLILIGNIPFSSGATISYARPKHIIIPADLEKLEEKLTPLLFALSPKSSFTNGFPEIPILSYEDDVIRSVIVETCVGSFAGEMLVEDVELEGFNDIEFRRRLRFKRMPNLIQTQIRIHPKRNNDFVDLGEVEFWHDLGVLVQPYLTPMVAGTSLICSYLDERIRSGLSPKALCLGVGGGALLGFLSAQLGFEVFGVEVDEVVLRIARQYFGLKDCELIRVCEGDGIEFIEKLSTKEQRLNNDFLPDQLGDGLDDKFDVIMVDLDSSNTKMGISAPPLEFLNKSVLLGAKMVLHEHGILISNVIPPTGSSFYGTLIHEFQEVFEELYEIDVGNGENFVLIATMSKIETASSDSENSFLTKLKRAISGALIDSIKKI